MRCEDIIRALAAPLDGQDTTALAEHLNNCSACAQWSARMASLDRLWDLTRPADPAPEQWDAVWNRIEQALDSDLAQSRNVAASNPPISSPHAPIRITPGTNSVDNRPILRPIEVQRGIAPAYSDPIANWFWSKSRRQRFLISAMAAVYLLAFGFSLIYEPRPRTKPEPARVAFHGGPVEDATPPFAIGSVDIEEGELVVIRTSSPAGAEGSSGSKVVRYEPDDGIDSWFVMFNEVESMPKPVVAVR